MPRPLYTPYEDKLIKEASLDDLEGLALRLGRKRQNLLNRRTRLLRGDDIKSQFRKPPPEPKEKSPIRDPAAGRPDWFDTEVLHTRLRSGR